MNELEKANTINWSEKVRNLDENIRREIGIEGENEAKHILIKVQTKAAECIEPAFIVDEDDTFLDLFVLSAVCQPRRWTLRRFLKMSRWMTLEAYTSRPSDWD